MTYGLFINRAMAHLAHALTNPVHLATIDQAVVLAEARARMYRGLAGALDIQIRQMQRSLDATRSGILTREFTLVQTLRQDLTASAQLAAQSTEEHPTSSSTPPTSTAGHLAYAADAAGGGWDLLATHLAPTWADTLTPDGLRLRAGAARVSLADATLLTHGLTTLDARLIAPLREQANAGGITPAIQQRLLTTAADAERLTGLGTASFAAAITTVLRTEDRRDIDALQIAPIFRTDTDITSIQQAIAAVDALRTKAHLTSARLGALDVSAIAAVAARIARLAAHLSGRLGAPATTAVQAMTAWRQTYMAAAEFGVTHPAHLAAICRRWCAYIDRQLATPTRLDNPRWLPAVQEMTAYLPYLAQAAQRSIHTQQQTGHLYHNLNMARQHDRQLYRQIHRNDQRIPHLSNTLTETGHHSLTLAQAMRELSPATHPRPRLVTNALRTAARQRQSNIHNVASLSHTSDITSPPPTQHSSTADPSADRHQPADGAHVRSSPVHHDQYNAHQALPHPTGQPQSTRQPQPTGLAAEQLSQYTTRLTGHAALAHALAHQLHQAAQSAHLTGQHPTGGEHDLTTLEQRRRLEHDQQHTGTRVVAQQPSTEL